ncbi:hypothetical protein [Bacillus sp. 'calajunan']|uniref:hypothetical protein n=1 Tax=Bacillus sp. 'calajunan' TaxID=3447457 RepID=UPI003EE14F6F
MKTVGKKKEKGLLVGKHCCTIWDKGSIEYRDTLIGDEVQKSQECSAKYSMINPEDEDGDDKEFLPNTPCE